MNVAEPPEVVLTRVLSTALLMPDVNAGVAVLFTVSGLAPQTFTVWLALPVVPVVFVVKVAVLLSVLQVPDGAATVREYLKVVGLGSVDDTVPNVPPPTGSVTVTLLSTSAGVVLAKSPVAVPDAEESGVNAAPESHAAVAVFVNAEGEGADA